MIKGNTKSTFQNLVDLKNQLQFEALAMSDAVVETKKKKAALITVTMKKKNRDFEVTRQRQETDDRLEGPCAIAKTKIFPAEWLTNGSKADRPVGNAEKKPVSTGACRLDSCPAVLLCVPC